MVGRLRRWLSFERLRGFGRTMIWVVPMTLLTWIWAQQEQLGAPAEIDLPVQLAWADTTSRSVKLLGESTVTFTFRGPREEMDRLRSSAGRLGAVTLEVPADTVAAGRNAVVSVLSILPADNVFASSNLSVLGTRPTTLELQIEPYVSEELRIRLPDSLMTDFPSAVFTPETVRVRAPQSDIDRLRQLGLFAIPDVEGLPEVLRARPGESVDVRNVPVRLPGGLQLVPQPQVLERVTLRRAEVVEEEYELPTLLLRVSLPAGLLDHPPRILVTNSISGLRVVGPARVIAQLRAMPADQPRPEAVLDLGREDVIRLGKQRRPVQIIRLPQGVRLVGSPPEVEFEVIELSNPDLPVRAPGG